VMSSLIVGVFDILVECRSFVRLVSPEEYWFAALSVGFIKNLLDARQHWKITSDSSSPF